MLSDGFIFHGFQGSNDGTLNETHRIIVSSTKSVEEHTLEAIVLFNQGADKVEIKGTGFEVNKAVDIYNSIVDRLGKGVELEGVETGSEVKDKRRLSFILIKLRRVY
ncbi:ribonuclease P subunit p25 family protein [Sulfodiicoccus acidiphilus]|nr:DNA-binding protein [Sulfodiicoccus acidiphilus]